MELIPAIIQPQLIIERLGAGKVFKIFVSYATEDRAIVAPVVDRLKAEGFSPWYDQHILPGENWKLKIEENQRDANVVLIFMSQHSVFKRGFVQREANLALDRLNEMLPGDIYIIPIRLDDCDPPQQIKDRVQIIDNSRPDFWERLLAALRKAAHQRGVEVSAPAEMYGPFGVRMKIKTDNAPGSSGYQIQIEYPEFLSSALPSPASELTGFFEARARQKIIFARTERWRGLEDRYAYLTDGSTHNESFSINVSNENVVSVICITYTYSVGAAHGNRSYDTFNFAIGKSIVPFTLEDVLMYDGLKALSQICFEKVKQQYFEKLGRHPDESSIGWIESGLAPKWENYQSVAFSASGVTCLFPPYQLTAYAFGSWVIEITFHELRDILTDTKIRELFNYAPN